MNQFLKKIIFISLPVLGFVLLTFWQADGKADAFYLRFTTPKQQSLIIGTSRAAQGILPAVIDSVTGKTGTFNYAMTMGNSPYGKVYFESIKQKLDPTTKNGLFILEVSPWSICSETEDEADFREVDLFLSKLHCVDCKPNIEYLTRFYSEQFINLWIKPKSILDLHQDGWLEVSVGMDSAVVEGRIDEKMDYYGKKVLPKYHYSEVRYAYLRETIELLRNHGEVYLLRVPVHSRMYDLEYVLMSDFDDKIEALSESVYVPYVNYGADGSRYQFTDGNHLWKGSSKEFSIFLGERIKSNEGNPL